MLSISTRNLGDVTVFGCAGQLTFPHADTLRTVAESQTHTRIALLDLAEIRTIDAAGLGMLVSLRSWASDTGVTLKLMNLTPRVEYLLELTNLKGAFEICSLADMLEMLCRAFAHARFAGAEATTESPGPLDEIGPVAPGPMWNDFAGSTFSAGS
jgi:anti-anti-sigma factor